MINICMMHFSWKLNLSYITAKNFEELTIHDLMQALVQDVSQSFRASADSVRDCESLYPFLSVLSNLIVYVWKKYLFIEGVLRSYIRTLLATRPF